ncbi:hypothetical protein BCR42DRAFT_446219 [Absidia repens]|uniref:J domain-containing protein n=1 Tax=Absidia repens TaxID=90262 RepID=A0A1X2IYB2_9FUNG|nr:hypothetical protein BCR42DRAFT_446219 [Absidia repens]
MSKDYYSVLGISKTANVDEIKKAYKIQARKWHPDRNKDNTVEAKERFQNVGEAFEVLSDADKRMRYDFNGQQGSTPYTAYPTYSTYPPYAPRFSTDGPYNAYKWRYTSSTSRTSSTPEAKKFKTNNFRSRTNNYPSDNFDNSGDNGTRFPPKFRPYPKWSRHSSSSEHSNSNLNSNSRSSETDTNTNTNTKTNNQTTANINTASNNNDNCGNNTNDINKDNINSSNTSSNVDSDSIHGSSPRTNHHPTSSMPNPALQPIKRNLCLTLEQLYTGTTKQLKVTRKTQQGTKTEKILSVEIKPGTKDGFKILFPGEGDEMANGQKQDIEFTIEELAHQSYSREGDNLHVTVNVTLVEALMGFSKELKALDQTPITLSSNTTIQPGQRIRMNRKGMPNVETGRRGDLLVTYNVILPLDITDNQKQQIADVIAGIQ